MPERSRTHFDPTAISEALHTTARTTTDLAFGPGQRYELPGGQANLEIFPEHYLSRITTATSRLELFDSPPPRVVHGQVVISRESGQEPRLTRQEETSLSVSPEGTVIFGYVSTTPATPAVVPAEPATAPEPAQQPLTATPAGEQASDNRQAPRRTRPSARRSPHSTPYQPGTGQHPEPSGNRGPTLPGTNQPQP